VLGLERSVLRDGMERPATRFEIDLAIENLSERPNNNYPHTDKVASGTVVAAAYP